MSCCCRGLQFALTIMFHYLFPPLDDRDGRGAGLSRRDVPAGRRIRSTKRRPDSGPRSSDSTSALGVVTGIVMEFEFGTNWAAYSRFVGDVFGSALAAEGIFAFFLESGFLAVLLFGWDRVGPQDAFLRHADGGDRRHLFVDLDRGGQFVAADTGGFAPGGADDQRNHVPAGRDRRLLGHGLQPVDGAPAGSCLDRGVHPGRVLRDEHLGLVLAQGAASGICEAVVHGRALAGDRGASLAQFVSGHFQAVNVAAHQPAKLAAMEGLYKSEEGTPLAPVWLAQRCGAAGEVGGGSAAIC